MLTTRSFLREFKKHAARAASGEPVEVKTSCGFFMLVPAKKKNGKSLGRCAHLLKGHDKTTPGSFKLPRGL
jgi:hypothetical protein